jgi:HEAT repeat protein
MQSPEYEALEASLAQAGAPTRWSTVAAGATLAGTGAVAALVNTEASAKPYVDLLLAALPRLAGMEQEMVVRALSERGMPKAGPVLAAMLRALAHSPHGPVAWALGNAVAAIQDPATFDAVVELCSDQRLGMARQMLFGLLPRIGTEAAYDAALAALADDTVRGHALEALGRFGKPEALDRILGLATRKGLYEAKAKATAIRRLERAAARRSADA